MKPDERYSLRRSNFASNKRYFGRASLFYSVYLLFCIYQRWFKILDRYYKPGTVDYNIETTHFWIHQNFWCIITSCHVHRFLWAVLCAWSNVLAAFCIVWTLHVEITQNDLHSSVQCWFGFDLCCLWFQIWVYSVCKCRITNGQWFRTSVAF